jgi:hypothetical protein
MALFTTRTNLMTGAVQKQREDFSLPSIGRPVRQVLVNESLRNLFVVDDRGQLFNFDIVDRDNPSLIEEVVLNIYNPHPQTSLSGLGNKVWYEGRAQPQYIWQSSSADDAFEAKLSLVPLSIGTLKAALFAMLLATPLAIMGAIYTAYFMSRADAQDRQALDRTDGGAPDRDPRFPGRHLAGALHREQSADPGHLPAPDSVRRHAVGPTSGAGCPRVYATRCRAGGKLHC